MYLWEYLMYEVIYLAWDYIVTITREEYGFSGFH